MIAFKNPLMLPAYLCGACGHELQRFYQEPLITAGEVLMTCYSSRCAQRGVRLKVALVETPVQGVLPLDETVTTPGYTQAAAQPRDDV